MRKCPYPKNPISGPDGTEQMKSPWNPKVLKAKQMNPSEKSPLATKKNSKTI